MAATVTTQVTNVGTFFDIRGPASTREELVSALEGIGRQSLEDGLNAFTNQHLNLCNNTRCFLGRISGGRGGVTQSVYDPFGIVERACYLFGTSRQQAFDLIHAFDTQNPQLQLAVLDRINALTV